MQSQTLQCIHLISFAFIMIIFPVIYTWVKIALFKIGNKKNHSEDIYSYMYKVKHWHVVKFYKKIPIKNYLSTCVTLRGLKDNDRRASDVWPLFHWPEISNGIIMWMRWGIWGKISCIQLMNKISIFVHWFYASEYTGASCPVDVQSSCFIAKKNKNEITQNIDI